MQIVENFWRKPVTVRLQNGLPHTFHSIEDSIDFLESEWPTRYGTHHRRALDLCRAAVARMVPSETAREALISACLEAGMPLLFDMSRARSGFGQESHA